MVLVRYLQVVGGCSQVAPPKPICVPIDCGLGVVDIVHNRVWG
jgi:hypothetical protein